MAVVHLVQHAEKRAGPGDPGLTTLGHWQADRTGVRLRAAGIIAVRASPLRRARETADHLAAATGLSVVEDGRLRERLNWSGQEPFETFVAEWDRTVRQRDYEPAGGDSSHAAAQRLIAFLHAWEGEAGPVAAVTHGGVTVDLLRTLLGDDAVLHDLMAHGVRPCAVTTLHGLRVAAIADDTHLR